MNEVYSNEKNKDTKKNKNIKRDTFENMIKIWKEEGKC